MVVTGHRADEIEARLPGIAYRTGKFTDLKPAGLTDWFAPERPLGAGRGPRGFPAITC